jgi:hypothetical protein
VLFVPFVAKSDHGILNCLNSLGVMVAKASIQVGFAVNPRKDLVREGPERLSLFHEDLLGRDLPGATALGSVTLPRRQGA